MRHVYTPLMDKPQAVRDKVFALIKAGLESASQKLDALLSEHCSDLPQAAESGH